MKITKKILENIIKEEIKEVILENQLTHASNNLELATNAINNGDHQEALYKLQRTILNIITHLTPQTPAR